MKWNNLKYILGLIVLIAGAIMLPQLVFAVWDRGNTRELGQGSRLGIDSEGLREDYELSLRNRLYSFARGLHDGKSYYISEMSFELSGEEQTDILGVALAQEPMRAMSELFAMYGYDFADIGKNYVADWKKYAIYDTERVSFICWYVNIWLDSVHRVQMLFDAEDGTLYYIRGIRQAQQEATQDMQRVEYDKYRDVSLSVADASAAYGFDAGDAMIIWEVLSNYYGADTDQISIKENTGISFPLYYEDETLDCELFWSAGDGKEGNGDEGADGLKLQFALGITAIGERMSEMGR